MVVIIDTSIFMQENFFSGKKITRLATLANQGFVKLFITTVIDEEIKSNIGKSVQSLLSESKRFTRALDTKHKIVKNLYRIDELTVDYQFIEESLLRKYEEFKDFARIKVIKPEAHFNITSILELYFSSSPPFNVDKKKSEFPDAISVKIAEDYCKSNNIKATYLSADADFEGIQSTTLTFNNNLNNTIELITKSLHPDKYQEEALVFQFIKEEEGLFLSSVESEVSIELAIYFENLTGFTIEIPSKNISINQISIDEYDIFDIGTSYVGFSTRGTYQAMVVIDSNHLELLEDSLFQIKEGAYVEMKGEFEMTFYYDYDFPYEVYQDAIDFDEDERKVKSVVPM